MSKKIVLFIIVLSCLLTGCSSEDDQKYPSDYPASASYTLDDILYPQNSGTAILDSDVAMIDYSNVNQGYIIGYLKSNVTTKIKIQISLGETKYNYDLTSEKGTSYPLQLGDGTYTIKILENIEGTKYAIKQSIDVAVKLDNELSPFLYPNILVNYYPGDTITEVAIDVVKDDDDDLTRIKTIYEYVAGYLTYDDDKAKLAKQQYLIPDLESLLKEKKGICFDYASMMVAMLRINHIPSRLICGGTDKDEYHSWVEVYLEGKGWVNPDIFIDQKTWTIMDPTFASSKYDYDGQYVQTLYY
ncbi:transglutaminase-like domain-containing protein [Thomasclavelia sp.]|uniref:transglutaminase-like domain-containing protein n=1 Tax=Thomasclavelia sp. TaxID=3025757 RepID=UPI0025FD7EB9|nr:transglutaminase-like domain-containing protein [Thomasclavelia sp.]